MANDTLTFTLVQAALHWQHKAANLAMLEEKIAATPATEIVVLPEMFSTGFTMDAAPLAEPMDGPAVAWMRRIAIAKRCILTGSLILTDAGKYYNRLIWMLPNGNYGWCDKRHLFTLAGEHETYTPGDKKLIASVNGWKVQVQICYDLRFPVWARQQKSMPYDVLLNVANWPAARGTAWSALLQARAIENQCYAIGVNRTGTDGNGVPYGGNTRVYGPLGQPLYRAGAGEEVHTITLHRPALLAARQQFPFLQDGDDFRII